MTDFNENIEALLPQDFSHSLSLLPDDKAVSLLTRHSIREQAENFNAHYSLQLTDEGRALAHYWGSLQPFERFSLFSSPIERCIDTARHMYQGKHGEMSEVEVIRHLAEPGCFIPNRSVMERIGHIFVNDGPIPFLNHILQGKFNEHLAMEESISRLLQGIKNQHSQNTDELFIHVSHDTILAAFVYQLLGHTELEDDHWPRMMEGVYLWFEDKVLHGVWRAEKFEVDASLYL